MGNDYSGSVDNYDSSSYHHAICPANVSSASRMPTFRRSPNTGHYYIRRRTSGTWQIRPHALLKLLEKYPAVDRAPKVELTIGEFEHLKRQDWIYQPDDTDGLFEPWKIEFGGFYKSLDEFSLGAIRYPELGIRHCANPEQWELGIVIPPISDPWLHDLSATDYRQFSNCEFSVDGRRFAASRLVGGPFFVSVAARNSPDFPISTKSVWPSSIDISALDCHVAPPNDVVVFMPPGTRGTKLHQPRATAEDEIVVLTRTSSITEKSVLGELQSLSDANNTKPGVLQGQPDWSVYWIRVPESGTQIWKFLSQKVGLQEARSKWTADLVLPLPLSYGDMGELVVPPCDRLLVRISHRTIEHATSLAKIPNIVWEHGGKVLKAESTPKNTLNPHYLELEPPKGARAATLWVVGADSMPSSISLEFAKPPSTEFASSLNSGLAVEIQVAESRLELGALEAERAIAEIHLPPTVDYSSIQAAVSRSDSRVPVKVLARSIERLSPVPVQDDAFDSDFIAYVVRMARQGQPIDVEFDAGGWGRISVRLLPDQADATPSESIAQQSMSAHMARVRWQSLASAKGQRRWAKDPDGRGRITTSYIRPKSI